VPCRVQTGCKNGRGGCSDRDEGEGREAGWRLQPYRPGGSQEGGPRKTQSSAQSDSHCSQRNGFPEQRSKQVPAIRAQGCVKSELIVAGRSATNHQDRERHTGDHQRDDAKGEPYARQLPEPFDLALARRHRVGSPTEAELVLGDRFRRETQHEARWP
jgi:hypothetical protein